MFVPDFNYHKPQTLSDAYKLLDSNDNIAPIAGGTDILVEIKNGVRRFDDIMSLKAIDDLEGITIDGNSIIIGPNTTHTELLESEIISESLPALASAASTIGTDQIRNVGTIGGNLCTCASCADTAPALIAYDAFLEIGSMNGIRLLKLTDFLKDHHETALKKGELLTKIFVPKPKKDFYACFNKFGLRDSASISVASVAISIENENGIVKTANVVIGACAPTPILAPSAIKEIIGKDIQVLKDNTEILEKIGKSAAKDAYPIDDLRGTAEYRKSIIKTLIKRTAQSVLELV